MKYKIIHAYCFDELESNVNDEIKKGYKPVGGLVVKDDLYMQAMFRELDGYYLEVRTNNL